jgi:hypothetical protein
MIASSKLALIGVAGVSDFLMSFGRDLGLMKRSVALPRDRGALATWFHPFTLRQLEDISLLVDREPHGPTRSILSAILSDTLFACSAPRNARTRTGGRRRHHWGWVADNVIPKETFPHDARDVFLGRLASAIDVAVSTTGLTGKHQVIQADSIYIPLLSESVDLVVTSPPYLGMIDYARANRLTYLWNGWHLAAEMQGEIGARFKRGRKNVEGEYLVAMARAGAEIARVLKPNAYCAIVLGSSRRFPSTATAALDSFDHVLRRVWGPVPRVPTRRRVSEREGSDSIEYITVYRKDC